MPNLGEALDQQYIFEYSVGLWTLGSVQVLKSRADGKLRTCKVVPKDTLRLRGGTIEKLKRLCQIQHPHVNPILEVIEDSKAIYIISNKTEGGDVAEWVERVEEGYHIQESTCAAYIRQLLLPLAQVHANGIHHGDLSPSTLLLTSKMPDAVVKVGDMGVVDVLDPDRTSSRKQPNAYQAPEVFSGTSSITTHQDMWSVGAIAHSMLVGHPPPRHTGTRRSRMNLLYGDDSDGWADRGHMSLDFVEQLLHPSPAERPTAAQALQHPWLKSMVPLPVIAGTDKSSMDETRKKLLCYMLGVLLMPTLVPHKDFEQLLKAFRQADADQDGFVPRPTVKVVLRRRCSVEDAIRTALTIVDIGQTGFLDLCACACADVIAREFFASGPTSQPLACPLTVGDLLPRMVDRFFTVYGDQKQPRATLTGIAMRLRTATARDVETHAGVQYDEVLADFPEETVMDSRVIMEKLVSSGGRGTPLDERETPAIPMGSEGPWGTPCGGSGFDGVLTSVFATCGLGSVGNKREQRRSRAGG